MDAVFNSNQLVFADTATYRYFTRKNPFCVSLMRKRHPTLAFKRGGLFIVNVSLHAIVGSALEVDETTFRQGTHAMEPSCPAPRAARSAQTFIINKKYDKILQIPFPVN